MPSVRAADVRIVLLQHAAEDLRRAAGSNGQLSRAEQATLDAFLQARVEEARTPGRAVAVDTAMARVGVVVDDVFSRVNVRGPTWLSEQETRQIVDSGLQLRVWQARDALRFLDDAALRASAVAVVRTHAEPVAGIRTGKPIPAIDSGSHGLAGHFVDGPAAERLAALANAWNIPDDNGNPTPPQLPGFDPKKSQLFVVRTSEFDNEKLIVSAIDRRTGAATRPFVLEIGTIFGRVPESTFVALLGPLSTFGATRYDFFDLDYRQLSPLLLAGSRDVDLGNPLRAIPAARVTAVETSVRDAVASVGFPRATVHAGGPSLVAQEQLPGNVISAAEAVRRGLASFLTDATDPDSPLGILVERVASERNETTPSLATQQEARRRLEVFLDDPSTRLRFQGLEEEPEGGPAVRDRWVLQMENDTLSATVHFAIVDRAGVQPTTNYGFN